MKLSRILFPNVSRIGNSARANRRTWLKSKLASLPTGLTILDAGAGELQYKTFCNHLNYVSQDFGRYDGKGDGSGFQTKKRDNTQLDIISDITNIPVESASFDAVLCTEVLEHVPDPRRALEELTRVLKPGGHLLVTAPFFSLTHYAPFHFSTGLSRYFFKDHLGALGYDIQEIVPNGNYFEFVAQEVKRLQTVSRQYSNRKLSWIGLLASALLLGELFRINRSQAHSEELGCWGHFVHAIKK